MKNLKVALVHDYLREYGGAERVLEALHEIFPDAPTFTAYVNLENMGENGKRFKDWKIIPSWFQKFPFANKLLSPFRIFGPMMFESFDLSEYDLVISSSSATHLAKAVITKPETLHISYIHTPPRFLYGYVTSFNYKKKWWTRIGGEIINHFMRIYDFEVSQRPDILVANSNLKSTTKNSKLYYLVLSRLVRGKGVDVVVEACGRLGLPLKVAGSGPELEALRGKGKGESIEFLGWVSDEERISLLQNAKALIVASEDEDFGITSIEAQAAGTPVIAPASGGFLETIINGKTGLLYGGVGMVTVDALIEALQKFELIKFNEEDLRKNAGKFSKERFKKEILELVENNLKVD